MKGFPVMDFPHELVRRIERFTLLDKVADPLAGLVGKIVAPRRVRNLLSGTWMGHPAHPMLTDLPIGAWASAVILDVMGNQTTAPTADALVGLGVLTALPTAVTGLNDLADIVDREDRTSGPPHAIGNV